MKLRDKFIHFSVIFISLTAAGCGGSSTNSNPDEESINLDRITERYVSVNPTYQTLYNYVDQEGAKINFSGQRDSDGLPDILTGLDYTDKDGNEYIISYDENGLPGKITDKKGIEIELDFNFEQRNKSSSRPFDPQEGTSVNVSSIGANISFDTGEEQVNVKTSVVPDIKTAIRLINREIRPFGNVNLTVTNCGKLIDPDGGVAVIVDKIKPLIPDGNPVASLSTPYRAQRISKGRYVSSIPNRAPFARTAQQMCTSVADAVSTMCNIYNPNISGAASIQLLSDPVAYGAMCSSLALAAGTATVAGGVSAPLTPAAMAAIDGACVALFTGGLAVCESIFATDANQRAGKFNIPDPARDNVAQKFLCPNVESILNAYGELHDFNPQEFYQTIKGVAYFNNGESSVFSEQKDIVLTDDQFPDLKINSSIRSLDGFTTTPEYPKSGEAYTARADLSCVKNEMLSVIVERDGKPLTLETKLGLSAEDSITVNLPDVPEGKADVFKISSENIATNETFRISTPQIVSLKNYNEQPKGEDQSITTKQDETVDIILNASDTDGDDLTYSIVALPEHGILSGSIPNLTYVPFSGYNGSDLFTFIASDGENDSNEATVSITVLMTLSTTQVSIEAKDNQASEKGSQTGSFTVSRSGDLTESLSVNLSRAGSATYYTDYSMTPSFASASITVTIPAGESSIDFVVIPRDDVTTDEGEETVQISILTSNQYEIAGSEIATVSIEDRGQVKFFLDKVTFAKVEGDSSDLCGDILTCIQNEREASFHALNDYWTLSKTAAEYTFNEIYTLNNVVLTDYAVNFNFETPPSELTGGSTIPLDISGEASGFITGWYIPRSFTYFVRNKIETWRPSYNYEGQAYVLNSELPNYDEETGQRSGVKPVTTTTNIQIPNALQQDFVIGGRFGWDPPLFIQWFYKLEGSVDDTE